MCECWWLLGQALVQFTRTVEECLNRCAQLRQQRRDMRTSPRDRLNLDCKITNLERAGNCTRQAVQSVESRTGSLQATSKAVAGAPQVAGKGRAENSRVKDDGVFDHIRNRPKGIHTVSTLCQPVCCPICPAEGLCPALAGVKLGEYGLCLYRIHWIVAQHVPFTGSISDRCNCEIVDSPLIRSCISRSGGLREHSAHVMRTRHTNKLGESRVQRRDTDMHVPLRIIRRELLEWRHHAVAHRLGLHLRKIDRFFVPIRISIRAPGYCDGANTIFLRSPGAHSNIKIGRQLAPGPESHVA